MAAVNDADAAQDAGSMTAHAGGPTATSAGDASAGRPAAPARRHLLRHGAGLAAAAAAPALLPRPGRAAPDGGWPDRPVTVVVPFPPGGGTDLAGRLMAAALAARWRTQVIVDNRGGAGGQIGADLVARARPDGLTLLCGNIGTQSINPALYPRLPYDPDTAFAPVSRFCDLPFVMIVNRDVPARTASEFIQLARSQPGRLSYYSSGIGGSPHLTGELFKQASGTDLQHVPYRGGGPGIADLVSGQVQLGFVSVLEVIGHIRAGRIRALAVTGTRRVPALPDVPTLAESALPGFDAGSWVGFLAPAATPPERIERISADIRDIAASPDMVRKLDGQGAIAVQTTPARFAAQIASDRARYTKLIRDADIRAE